MQFYNFEGFPEIEPRESFSTCTTSAVAQPPTEPTKTGANSYKKGRAFPQKKEMKNTPAAPNASEL